MIEDLTTILGLDGYEFIVVWIACIVLALFIYELFNVLLALFRRVGGIQ